jgi:hypothetical protein
MSMTNIAKYATGASQIYLKRLANIIPSKLSFTQKTPPGYRPVKRHITKMADLVWNMKMTMMFLLGLFICPT